MKYSYMFIEGKVSRMERLKFCNEIKFTDLVEEPAGAGITGAAVGDVGEPDGFFWSSSEDSKDVWPVCLRGRPRDNRLEAALALLIMLGNEFSQSLPARSNMSLVQ